MKNTILTLLEKGQIIMPLIICCLLYSNLVVAQIGGNQVYNTNSSNNSTSSPILNNSINSTDSTLTIGGSILFAKKADYYLFTLGVKDHSKTVVECNKKLNNRIDAFLADLKGIGINEDDLYIDFVSQIRVYDHEIEGNTVTEFFDGFVIRKNIIIQITDLNKIENIIELASLREFYDIIKVEYYNDDVEAIYDDLFKEVMEIIEEKKARFLKYSSVDMGKKYRIASVNFTKYNPKSSYAQYNEAFETSSVTTRYTRDYIKKDVRKEKTFYYEGAENKLGVDRIKDDISPVVGIQYVMGVSVIYEIEK